MDIIGSRLGLAHRSADQSALFVLLGPRMVRSRTLAPEMLCWRSEYTFPIHYCPIHTSITGGANQRRDAVSRSHAASQPLLRQVHIKGVFNSLAAREPIGGGRRRACRRRTLVLVHVFDLEPQLDGLVLGDAAEAHLPSRQTQVFVSHEQDGGGGYWGSAWGLGCSQKGAAVVQEEGRS